jgi:hypothetical protein
MFWGIVHVARLLERWLRNSIAAANTLCVRTPWTGNNGMIAHEMINRL